MTLDELKLILPNALDAWAIPLLEQMPAWDITGNKREAAFIANVAVETRGLTHFEENLNYSATRLMQVWPKRFPDMQIALAYEHNPEALANKVYAGRMGNGDEASGDGWRYRGRGIPMLTGKDGYVACEHGIGQAVTENPDWLLIPSVSAQAGCWFWKSKGLAQLADAGDFEAIVRKWNGGLIGFAEREAVYDKALEVVA